MAVAGQVSEGVTVFAVTGRRITILASPDGAGMTAVAFSPDGTTQATTDDDNSGSSAITLWHFASRQ